MSFTKNLLKHSATYSASSIIVKLTGFILLPVYTRVFTPSDYGILALLGAFFGLYKTISRLGMQTGIIRTYLHVAQTEEEKKQVLSTAHWGLIFLTGSISIFPLIFYKRITAFIGIESQYAILLFILLLDNLIRIINYARLTYFRIHQLSKRYMIWNNVEFCLNTILAILLVVFLKMGILGLYYAQIISLIVIVVFFLPWFLRTLQSGFNFTIFKEIFSYGIHFILVNITSWIMNLSDRWILNLFYSTSVVGIYSIGYQFGMVFQIMVNGFKNQWGTSMYKMGSPENVAQTLEKTIMRYLLIMLILWVGLTLFIKDLLFIMTPTSYHQAYKVAPLVAGGYIMLGLTTILSAGVHLQRGGKWFWIFSSIGAIVNIGLNFLLIPRYGMMAAALTTLIAFCVQPVGFYWFTRKTYPLSLPWKKIGLMMLLVVGIYFINYSITVENILLSFVYKSGILILFLIIIHFSNLLYEQDKQILMIFLRKKINWIF